MAHGVLASLVSLSCPGSNKLLFRGQAARQVLGQMVPRQAGVRQAEVFVFFC